MKLTVKLDYACRAMTQLAKRYECGLASSIDQVAEAEEIPAKYLAQILSDLRQGRLVESRRGKQGGYLLSKEPKAVSLLDIVSVVEGDWSGESTRVGGDSGEAVEAAWKELWRQFEQGAESVSLADLAAREPKEMYYI